VKVVGFVGRRGAGKTLAMTFLAYFLKQKYDCKVKTNYWTAFSEPVDLYELIHFPQDIRDIVLAVDEIHLWLDSRASMSVLNRLFSLFTTQLRKRNIYFLWTSQMERMLEGRVWWQTDILVKCQTPDYGRTLYLDFIDLWGQWRRPEDVVLRVLPQADRFWKLYHTDQLFNPVESLKKVTLVREEVFVGASTEVEDTIEPPQLEDTPQLKPVLKRFKR